MSQGYVRDRDQKQEQRTKNEAHPSYVGRYRRALGDISVSFEDKVKEGSQVPREGDWRDEETAYDTLFLVPTKDPKKTNLFDGYTLPVVISRTGTRAAKLSIKDDTDEFARIKTYFVGVSPKTAISSCKVGEDKIGKNILVCIGEDSRKYQEARHKAEGVWYPVKVEAEVFVFLGKESGGSQPGTASSIELSQQAAGTAEASHESIVGQSENLGTSGSMDSKWPNASQETLTPEGQNAGSIGQGESPSSDDKGKGWESDGSGGSNQTVTQVSPSSTLPDGSAQSAFVATTSPARTSRRVKKGGFFQRFGKSNG